MKISEISLHNFSNIIYTDRDALIRPADISPLSAYCVLSDLFGEPNGDFDESKIQWCYLLKTTNAIIEVYDWKLVSWSIGVYLDLKEQSMSENAAIKAENIGNDFAELIKKLATQHSGKISKAVADTQQFVLQNPFVLYYQSANNLLEQSKKGEDCQDYCISAFFLFIASFEGLMNLIYELYAKPDLRDERIFDFLSREQIDIKVRLAPVYCYGFKSDVIDNHSETFKKFHSIVNLRNDFIHANFTKPMRQSIVTEDDFLFVVSSDIFDKNGFPKSIDNLTPDSIETVKNSIDDMVTLLANSMEPKFRHEFKKILYQEYISVFLEDGVPIIDI